MFIFLWIVLALLVGVWGNSKKVWGGFLACFIISIIFSPLIGAIAVAFSRPDERSLIRGDMKKCPYCAELIKKEAVVCKYCGKDVPPVLGDTIPHVEARGQYSKDAKGFTVIGGIILLIAICVLVSLCADSGSGSSSSPMPMNVVNTGDDQATAPQAVAPQPKPAVETQASKPQTPVIGNDGKPLLDDTNNPFVFATSSIQELIRNADSPAFENNVPGASGASDVSLLVKIIKVISPKDGYFLISDGSNYAILVDSPINPNTGNPTPVFQVLNSNVGKTVILYGIFTGGMGDSASEFQKLTNVQVTPSTPLIAGAAAYPLNDASSADAYR